MGATANLSHQILNNSYLKEEGERDARVSFLCLPPAPMRNTPRSHHWQSGHEDKSQQQNHSTTVPSAASSNVIITVSTVGSRMEKQAFEDTLSQAKP